MDQYTYLTKPEVEIISAKFGIRNISSFKLLSGGSENTNYLVRAEKGQYVLSICEQKSVEQATELVELLEHLRKNNFNTSKVVHSLKQESIIVWKDKPVIVKQFIAGKIVQDLAPHLLQSIGKELAKLHQIAAPDYLPKQLFYGQEQFKKVQKYAANSSFDIWLQEIQKYLSPYFNLDLPKSFIHSDLFWSNVIINEAEDAITILDFEEAAYYYRVYDIGMMIIGICGEGEKVNMEKASYLLKGYQQEIQLLAIEIKALKAFTIYAGASMTFWRHQNFNYVKPEPKMFNHYLGLKVLTDDIAGQAADCFIKMFELKKSE